MDKNVLLNSMFKHVCAFIDCARYCEIEPNNIEYRMQSHTVSGIVNSAFACEVLIKSLLVFHGLTDKKLRGHNLKILWGEFKAIDFDKARITEERMREWFHFVM